MVGSYLGYVYQVWFSKQAKTPKKAEYSDVVSVEPKNHLAKGKRE